MEEDCDVTRKKKEDCDVTLDFNLDHDYNEFINCLRRKLADHPKRESDIELHKIDFTDNHLLPERKTLGPARWIYINLSVGVSENNKRETTLAIRDDTVWFVGFMNQKKEWYEFGWGEITFIDQSIPLRCGSGYAELLGRSELMDLELGKCFVSNAVCTLSKYGGSTPSNSKLQRSAKVCLGKLIVMFCESARLCSYLETVKNCWVKSEKLTNFNQINYVKNWRTMSRAMMGWGHYTKGLKAIGIQGHKEARKEVHLILNSRPPKVKKVPGEEGQDKKPPGGGSNPQDSTEGQDRENGNNGGDHLSQPPDSNGTSQGDHKASPSNNGGRDQHAEHGRILMEVFKLGATASVDADPEDFVGKIAIFDGKLGQLIYKNEANRDAPSSSNDSKGDLVLVGPYRAISASGNVGLKISGTSSQDVLIWDPCTRTKHQCDELLTENIPGGLKLTYAVLSSAVEVSMRIDVFLFGNTTGAISVYGEITAHSNFFRKEEANVLLFRCGIDDKVELSRSSAGSTIPLIRSVVAWCIGSQLIINVDNLHFITTPINEGMSPTAKSLEFSFDDDTAKVRFQILEGIGYVRVSLDDTREYRDEPGNSLPRSLTNEVIKMDEDMSCGTELLDVHSSQLSLTFETKKLTHWLLHLINKSNHSYVAFRIPGGHGISKLSGILPPDSTSTYLATLETDPPLNMDVFSLSLENCVVSEEEETEDVMNDEDMEDVEDKEKDVDEIFDVEARLENIEKITFEVIVCRAADNTETCEPIQPEIKIGPTVIVQTIPDAGEASKDLEEKAPMVHMLPESSCLPVQELEHRPFMSEIFNISSDSESTYGHTAQVVVHEKQTPKLASGGGRGCASSMEFATGAMGTLLPKLGELLLEEYNLKNSVKKGIGDLKAELESMQVVLVKVSSVPLDQLDPQVKIWANEVRDLSYAIEDSLDSFVTRVEGAEPTKPKFKHLLKMARNKFTEFKAHHEIANDIEEIESKVRNIKERYDRYKIDDVVANLATTAVDPRLTDLYNKVSDLVGTDEPIDELMKILSEGAETSHKNLNIVSIVGFGGSGKTTLAKALYDKVSKTYECQAFVPVGQNQGPKKVLNDILFELGKELYGAAERLDERHLINQLREVLAGKRYFIVIDDLWDIGTWETIKYAFVGAHSESKIIITTRIVDVATRAGSIYRMKPLSDDNSKLLFYTRTCDGEEVNHDNQPDEVTIKILQKCGGVPLAIITIASLLVGKRNADWSKVYDAIGFGDVESEVIQNTRKILSFSYYDLPPYLKTCLLYLGMYPGDKFIEKKSLIWRWVSEGFVSDKQGIGSYELGESYYCELVNKNLIREATMYGEEGEIEGCHLHDMVLDLIRTMSMTVNFVTVQDTENPITSSQDRQRNRVHRLALHGVKVEHNPSIKMGHVRSFNAITCTHSGIPALSVFKVLRVLVIEECDFLEGHSLEHLGKLVQLRYLGLVKTAVKLPEGIGHDLRFLEVLDARGGCIRELPSSVGELQHLMCLWASDGTRMKGKIGKLTSLEELQLYHVEECPDFFIELGKLVNLRVLRIKFEGCEEIAGKDLAESVCHLHKAQFLHIVSPQGSIKVGSLEKLAPSSRLRRLYLENIIIPRMPSCINSLCVPLLSVLSLQVEVVEDRDMQALGRLPSLLILLLKGEEEKRISYTFGSDEFQKLEQLVTNIEITLGEGALPRLGGLVYCASAARKDSLVPWNNRCPLLDEVYCYLDCANSGRRELKAARAVLREAEITHTKSRLMIDMQNYSRKTARLIDALELILAGLDTPDGEEIAADQRKLRRMITSLETLLRDAADPRVGRYGEQELRGFVTKFKSLLHDDACIDQEEEADNSDALVSDDDRYYTDADDSHDGDNDVDNADDRDNDDGCDDDDNKQELGDNDVATSSGDLREGAESQP